MKIPSTYKKATIDFNGWEFEVEYYLDEDAFSGVSLGKIMLLGETDFSEYLTDSATYEIERLVLKKIRGE